MKLKSEKSFKDLKNKRWLRELELEVKNTGSRPIHYGGDGSGARGAAAGEKARAPSLDFE
ncbi:MAG TPA: hypothetical protein VF668_07220 [Pyrinomonadaceae bacterium]